MKRIRLLLTACAFLFMGLSVHAIDWTDKTSLITNPSFETDEVTSNFTASGSIKNQPTGWTVVYDTGSSNANTQQFGTANSSSTIQGIGTSHAPSAGDKYFYLRENWHGSTTYSVSQTIPTGSIPAGFYRLSVKLANFGSSATDYTLSIQEEGGTEIKKLENTTGNSSWQDWSVIAYKASDATSLTIKASMKGGSAGSSHWCLLLDDFRLEYLAASSVSSSNTIDITSCIANPSFEWNSYNGTKDAASSIEQNAAGHKYATGWTFLIKQTGWSNVANVTAAPADGSQAYEAWAGSPEEFKVYQALSTLPEGVYEISASARTETSASNDICTYATVGGKTVYSDPFDVSDIKSPWNGSENWQTLTARFSIIGDGAPEVGIHSTKFMQFDNFHLTYLGSDLLLSEANTAWNTAHTTLAGLDATQLPDAAEAAITEELAKSRPTTLTPLEAATSALQALIDSYAGIKAAFDEYKALKAQVEDLKNTSKYTFTGTEALTTFNSTLSTIDGNAEDATDAATITALLPDLKSAGNTFVSSIESNDGFDLTYNIVNNSFETGALSPWTTNGSNDTGVKENSNGTYTTTDVDGSYLFNTWNNGAGSKVSQTLSSLPNGYYTVTALVASDAGNTINILAGATTKAVASDETNGKNQFVEGTTDKTLVSDGSLEIGTNSSTWYKSDYFRLTYYTVKAGAAEAWAAAKAAAEAARDAVAYTNVTGSEKTDLLAEIAKAEPSTAEAYGTATTALQEATSTFIAAKDSYNGLATKRTEASAYTTEAWPYATTAKKTALDDAVAATPTNAEDAVTKTNAITTAIRQFVESNGVAEGVDEAIDFTSYIAGADPDTNTGWTSGIGVDNRDAEKYTDGDGNTSGKYYDGGWATNAGANINMSRTVTLPAGQYLLQVTARGSANLTTYTMSIGGETVNLPKEGSGAATGTFGHGWSDKYVVFESDGSTELTLAIIATSTEYQQWASFNRFRLTKLDAILADATDYTNLNNAIDAAEAKTLGFETGQYAPYNNVAVLQKLAEAKAVNQGVNNVQEDIQALTTYLNTAANWTANDGDVDAIYNGMYATVAEGQNYPDGWTRTNAWGQMKSGLSGDYATAYYNQPGSLQYGNQGVYTMPLAANTIYKLTFSYRSHENNSNNRMTVSVLNSEDGLAATEFAGNGSTSEWRTVSQRFRTGAAGNYVLTLGNGGNTWMTNVSLVKENEAANITIDEAATSKPQADPLANVTLTRTLSASYWSTFSVPFNTAIPSGWTVKEYDSENSVDNVIAFKDATTIEAGKPYLVKPEEDVVNPTFNNVTVVSTEGVTMGEGDYKFAAQIYNKSLATDGTIAYLSTTTDAYGQVIKKLTSGGIKGLRAYFIVPASGVAARIHFMEENETTGIESIDNGQLIMDNGAVYDLQGRKVQNPKRGMYIINGKKVIVK